MEAYFDGLARDFRYALRNLRQNPRFSLIAIFALALGIGASTIVFSVVYNVFFQALPYKNFNRSVVFEIRNIANAGGSKGRDFFSPAEFRAFRKQNQVFEEMIAYETWLRLLYDDGKSIHYLPLGATLRPLPSIIWASRCFRPHDYRGRRQPGRSVRLCAELPTWQREFGGDPKILGRSFVLRGAPTILSASCRRVQRLSRQSLDATTATMRAPLSGGGQHIARLKPGVTPRAAAADLDAIAHRLQKKSPKGIYPENFTVVTRTLLDSLIGSFKNTLYALLAAVFLLLLIACSNVANLLLARATAREREIAMRVTLGATRARLVRQLLVESFALAAAAAVAGLLRLFRPERRRLANSCRHAPRGNRHSHERARPFSVVGCHLAEHHPLRPCTRACCRSRRCPAASRRQAAKVPVDFGKVSSARVSSSAKLPSRSSCSLALAS